MSVGDIITGMLVSFATAEDLPDLSAQAEVKRITAACTRMSLFI
jgi:hypothetical protein